jgi:creatinine amidohydrolase
MERRLDYLNHNELKELVPGRIDMVLVPVGTIEAHGITPLGTDVIIPQALADRVAPEVNAIVAPAVPYGITRGLVGHPGTISIQPEVLQAYVGDLLKSLADIGFAKLVILNGHGGQTDQLKDTIFEAHRETRAKTLLIDWWYETDDIRNETLEREGGHAAADETACIVAIDPSLVKQDRYDESMKTAWSKTFTAYPFPGTIITYTRGDTSLNLDEAKCRTYFDRVTSRVVSIIKEVTAKWDNLAL